MIYPLIGMPQGAEWLVLLFIVVLIFGAKKLPELARGSGRALRIFKTETKGLIDDDDDDMKTPEQREIESRQSRTEAEADPITREHRDGTTS
ncbi:twin-arginine translocase TatA/TatE family subunit [Nocardioides speluncae]|uniref:twin-arginine translocase TatA/TatE family subunit n=1 Tax=Nocardioides speluncae TaxID=2670337 RepID=UPI001F0BF50F|nr:twin-arginine translocase TatA/TatE family subunit [Nocardioides speluncae]